MTLSPRRFNPAFRRIFKIPLGKLKI